MTPTLGPHDASDAAESLHALLGAARAGDERSARAILAQLKSAGILVPSGAGGRLQPAASILPTLRRAAAGSSTAWLLPCVVKPLPPDPGVAAGLSIVARELKACRPDGHVETYVAAGVEVAQLADGYVDLRSLLLARGRDDEPAAHSVYTTCLERLLDYVDAVDPHVRSALGAAGDAVAEPAPFDYAGRLRRATAGLAKAVGAAPNADASDWHDEVAGLCARPGGRWALFYDPKPANFLTPESALRTGRPAQPLYKVDLDWMLTLGPVAHQALVAVLSHPLPPAASGPGVALAELSALVGSSLPAADADADQLDALVVYHLYRNYASKLTAEPRQARELKPFLSAALERLRAVELPAEIAGVLAACDRLPAAA